MKIAHNSSIDFVKGSAKDSCGFLISNRINGFFTLGLDSRHSGFFVSILGKLFKIIDDIRVRGEVTDIVASPHNITRRRGEFTESFFMPMGTNTLVYEADRHEHIDLILDVREQHDYREWGRNYDIFVENQKIVIKFTKNYDSRDNDNKSGEEYTIYLVIEGDEDLHYKENREWIKKEYSYDLERKSPPWTRYLFSSIRLVAKRLVFSVAMDKAAAIAGAEGILSSMRSQKQKQEHYYSMLDREPGNGTGRLSDNALVAFTKARISLDCLKDADSRGIYCGLPWLMEFWLSDEAISLRALMTLGDFDAAKQILVRQLGNLINEDYRKEGSKLMYTCDCLGWHFKVWDNLISALSEMKALEKYFTKNELTEYFGQLEQLGSEFITINVSDSLLILPENSTWMSSIERGGPRIEMQALLLCISDLLYKITGKEAYREMEKKTLKRVRELFWNGKVLYDSPNDATVRPNALLAGYIYQGILTRGEWERCIDAHIQKLWLAFGGFATLDTRHEHFEEVHTGADRKSHHRGDSWYWINHVSAVLMQRINKEKYSDYINSIIEASSKELLWHGLVGHCAELSSASTHKSGGVPASAKAAATFIELVNEI